MKQEFVEQYFSGLVICVHIDSFYIRRYGKTIPQRLLQIGMK